MRKHLVKRYKTKNWCCCCLSIAFVVERCQKLEIAEVVKNWKFALLLFGDGKYFFHVISSKVLKRCNWREQKFHVLLQNISRIQNFRVSGYAPFEKEKLWIFTKTSVSSHTQLSPWVPEILNHLQATLDLKFIFSTLSWSSCKKYFLSQFPLT